MIKLLKDNQEEFIAAYKDQMQKIQSELKRIKKKVKNLFSYLNFYILINISLFSLR